MKILEFNKRTMVSISIVFIAIAFLLMLLNQSAYNDYLKLKEEYVEVDCIVESVDTVSQTATVSYTYNRITYEVVLPTTQYEVMDVFTGVIRPDKPDALRFDNGYSFWNMYSYCAIALCFLALLFDFIVVKRLIIKSICIKSEKIRLKVLGVNEFFKLRQLVVLCNGKEIKSEFFRTYESISKLQDDTFVDVYRKGHLCYIDLASYTIEHKTGL